MQGSTAQLMVCIGLSCPEAKSTAVACSQVLAEWFIATLRQPALLCRVLSSLFQGTEVCSVIKLAVLLCWPWVVEANIVSSDFSSENKPWCQQWDAASGAHKMSQELSF